LAYLKKLPLDKLKIDRSFVVDITKDQESKEIVSVIINLAKSLHLDIIAEGVEEEVQKDFLLQNQCHKIQGYLYSKPLTAQSFENFMREFN
jgi:EAL domain-containing protein (putative c-di-GMP-specific phosphodiesterase class I)